MLLRGNNDSGKSGWGTFSYSFGRQPRETWLHTDDYDLMRLASYVVGTYLGCFGSLGRHGTTGA